jgi:imidazole glycerol-phosphate synthase subunit HisH
MKAPKVLLVDYGLGNLRSVEMALKHVGAEVVLQREQWSFDSRFSHIILPGVGAFPEGARRIRNLGLDTSLIQSAQEGRPILGLCLGMQLLFESSSEHEGAIPGLGLLPGRVKALKEISPVAPLEGTKFPHIGWRGVEVLEQSGSKAISFPSAKYYFVHSFGVDPENPSTLATAKHAGIEFAAEVGQGKTRGVQFHPEKSGADGLRLLTEFLNLD